MLWTEAMLHPMGPPNVSGDWPAAPVLGHQTVEEPTGELLKVPCVTSDVVAAVWKVDHAKLCGKFLGLRRRTWQDADPPPALLPVEVWLVADLPARDRPRSNLVGPPHLLRRPRD